MAGAAAGGGWVVVWSAEYSVEWLVAWFVVDPGSLWLAYVPYFHFPPRHN